MQTAKGMSELADHSVRSASMRCAASGFMPASASGGVNVNHRAIAALTRGMRGGVVVVVVEGGVKGVGADEVFDECGLFEVDVGKTATPREGIEFELDFDEGFAALLIEIGEIDV